MPTTVEIRTQDPDLGSTIAFWCADLIHEFFQSTHGGIIVIADDAAGAEKAKHAARADTVVLPCSASDVELAPGSWNALARKAMVRAGLTHDWAAIDHRQIVERRARVLARAQRALGVAAPERAGEFLLRVDDFPSTAVGLEAFRRFHQVAHESRVPYLLAVTPFLQNDHGLPELSPDAVETLRKCVDEGAELALHGFTHVSRSSEVRNELLGMPAAELRSAIARADAHFHASGLETIGFVAPYNGYEPETFDVLAERFALICGGPESVTTLGYRAGPSFLKHSLYVPSYRGAYDVGPDDFDQCERLAADSAPMPVPVTLHWENTAANGFADFRAVCARLSGSTSRWSDFVGRAQAVRTGLEPQ